MCGGHKTQLGGEGNLLDANAIHGLGANRRISGICSSNQCEFGRVPDIVMTMIATAADACVIAQQSGLQAVTNSRGNSVRQLGQDVTATLSENLLNGHAVFGQGPGLVRADDRGAAERLNGG